MPEPKTYLTLQSIALPLLALAAFTAFCYFASPILIPIITSISLAYILSPIVLFLDKLKIPHFISVLLALLLCVVILGFFGYLIVNQSISFAQELPNYLEKVLLYLSQLKDNLTHKTSSVQEISPDKLQLRDFSGVTKYLATGLNSLIALILGLITVFFLTLFILNDYRILKTRLINILGSSRKELREKIVTGIDSQLRSFILEKFLTSCALALIYTAGFLIMGLNYAYIWGPLAGFLELVPYIGPFLGLIPPVIVAGIQFNSIFPMLWVFLFYEVIQILESNLITPKLLERSMNLNPLAMLIASMYWAWLWGAIGIVLAVPITAAFKVVCDHIESLKPIGIMLGGKKEE